jgi:hypothetical protein
MAVAFVQKAGSNSATGATLTLTVGKDSGTSIVGFASTVAGHMLSLAAEAPGGVYVTTVTDSKSNVWQIDSQGGSSSSGVRTSLASCIISTPLLLNDTITITWSATPATAGAAEISEFSGVAASGGKAVVDPNGVAASHGSVATPTLTLGSALTVSGCLAVCTCASSSSTGTFSITTPDADSGGTWHDLAYPAQPGKSDTAWQAVPGATLVQAAWSNSAGPPQNTDVALVCYQPAGALSITLAAQSGMVGTAMSAFPTISGGTSPYTLSLNSGSGPLPPGLTLVAGGGGGPVGDFGSTYINHNLTGTQPDISYSTWINGDGTNPGVGRTPTLLKVFFGQSDGTGSLTSFPTTPGGDLQYAISHGMKAILCYKPAFNSSLTSYDSTAGTGSNGNSHGGTQADWNALKTSITSLLSAFPANATRKIEVCLYQEIEHEALTPVQYWSLWAFYGSAVDAAAGTGHRLHIASASYAGKLGNYFPAGQGGGTQGPSTAIVSKASTDCYTHSWLNGYRLDGNSTPGGTPTATSLVGLCQAHSVTFFGVTEMGMGQNTTTGQVPDDTNRYIDYLTAAAAAYPGTTYAWFGESEKGTNDLIPGFASGLNGGYNAPPHLRDLADTITGAGGAAGTPEVEGTPTADGTWTVTLKATDSVAATATVSVTFTIVPLPPPPPPPPPVVIPAAKSWRFIIASPQPSGTWLAEIGQAQQRSVTFRSDPGQYHEATVDINGYDPVAELITPLQTDLQVVLNSTVLAILRFGADQDTADTSTWRYQPSAQDYREVLRRRSLAYGGGPNFTSADVADIAWGLLKTGTNTSGQTGVQGYPGGNLGIARGLGKDGLGITQTINYIKQSFAGIEIDNLAAMVPGQFDWDVSAYGPADLRLDLWAPNRGVNRGVVLEYGGGLVQSWQRSVDPSTYANDVYLTGQAPSGGGSAPTPVQLDASDIASRVEGRWSQVIGTTFTTQSALNASASWELADAEVVSPTYTVTLYPGVWEGPEHIWIGDTVTVRINAGRLSVNDSLRVTEMAFDINSSNQEVLTLTIGRLPWRLNRKIPEVFRRLRSLESL